ncbi:MAG: hypothetical protein MJ077_03445 [Oscillospiraceae bacterium]|nr:hypothetical protein [Oscillospiraceae bacterium]
MKKIQKWALKHENLFLFLSICICGALGGGLYLLVAHLGGIAPAIDVLLCCIGYSGVIFGFLGSLFFLYRNSD